MPKQLTISRVIWDQFVAGADVGRALRLRKIYVQIFIRITRISHTVNIKCTRVPCLWCTADFSLHRGGFVGTSFCMK